jgi:hypothetical protein
MKRILLLLSCVACLHAEISAPLIGFVRDLKGALRPVHGVSGAFVLGEALRLEADTAAFRGASGCVRTAAGSLTVRDGKVSDEPWQPECSASQEEVALENGEVVILGTGVRLRLSESVESIEQVADGWFALRSAKTLFLLRTKTGAEAIYTLPEAAQ